MKYYEVVTKEAHCGDEWTEYSGFDKSKAINAKRKEDARNAKNTVQDYSTEIRVYHVDSTDLEEIEDALLGGSWNILNA